MSDFLPFARPDIGEAEIEAVVEALRSGWVTTGPRTKEFESAFAEKVGAKHAVALNSCTAALHLSLEALGIEAGDEVIVPTMTFAASAEVVRYLDAKPVLVDVRASDHLVTAEAIDAAITPRTRAVIPVHFGGQSCDMDEIVEVARARNIAIVEDAAHSFPASYKGRPIGTIGDTTCFSFYATKTITTGEGGMLTTEREDLADRARVMSLHGMSRDAWKRYTKVGSWRYDVVAPGYKYNLTDSAASLGLVQLGRAESMRARRAEIAARYDAAFASDEALEGLSEHDDRTHANHLYVIKVRPDVLDIDRDQLIIELRERGIGTSVHFIPLHVHSYYRETYGYVDSDFPVASDCFARSVSLPIYTTMSDDDVGRVIDAVTDLTRVHRR